MSAAEESGDGSVNVPASLTVFGASARPAVVTVTRPSPGGLFKRAAKAAGVFWAFAFGCVFIPGLHFVLVPSFLAIGVAAGLRHVRDAEVVSRVRGTCPRCGREQDFAAGNRLVPTCSLDCPACHNTLTLALDGLGGPRA